MIIETEAIKEAVGMMVFLGLELTLLFLLISYLVGLIQEWVSPDKVRKLLASRGGRGYFLAALMGALTPFCSCSTIPFLKGLLRARAGFGVMMVFLLASPLLNPVIMGLFVVTFGWKVSLLYFAVAAGVSVLGGYVLERLGFEKQVKSHAWEEPEAGGCCCSGPKVSRWRKAWISTWSDFKSVLPYLAIGVFLGGMIYGLVPSEWIVRVAGDDKPWSVPIAAVIGIPLYIRAEAVIPLSMALVSKGMGMGPVMALSQPDGGDFIKGSVQDSFDHRLFIDNRRNGDWSRLSVHAFILIGFQLRLGDLAPSGAKRSRAKKVVLAS